MCTEPSSQRRVALLLVACLAAFYTAAASPDAADQVRRIEQAFADSMAARDFDAFVSFLSPEAVFFSGDTPLRGAEAVAAAWKPYFDEADGAWKIVFDKGEKACAE